MNIPTMLIFCSWPDVPLNRNDSELEIFVKYLDIIDTREVVRQMLNNFVDDEMKNNNQADNFRKIGNTFYADSLYTEALKLYNLSISRAPRDSIEFGLAVANRSAVLFDMEKYEECLEDINTALKSEYPKDLRYKIYLRQSKTYLKLNLNLEVARSLRKAQESLDNLNLDKLQISTINNKILEIKNQLKKQLEAAPSDNKPNDNIIFTEPFLNEQENPKFINAAKTIDLKYSKKLGRHLVANTEIKKGDVLLLEKPYAFIAGFCQEKYPFNFCAFCIKRAYHCIPCSVCVEFFYCSDNCRQTAWDLSHRWKCLGQRRKIINTIEQQLCLSILFQASRDGFQVEVEDDMVYGNKENNYPFINKLLTHKHKVSTECFEVCVKYAVWLVLYLKNFTDYFDWLYVHPNRPEGIKEDLYKFVGGQLLKYLLQIRCNAMFVKDRIVSHIFLEYRKLIEVILGLGVYVSTSLINHSCLPNAIQSFHGTKIVVKAWRDIKKDTEITISYLNKSFFSYKTEERQSELEKFMFTCSCRACTDSSFTKLRAPFLCPRCRGKAFQVKQEIFAKCSECHLVFNAIEHFQNHKRISDLFIAFSFFKDQNLLDEIYKLMKRTFHKYNEKYMEYYLYRFQHYDKTGEIKKCVDTQRSLVELSKNINDDTSKQYLFSLLNLVYGLAKYCKILRKENSKNYRQYGYGHRLLSRWLHNGANSK